MIEDDRGREIEGRWNAICEEHGLGGARLERRATMLIVHPPAGRALPDRDSLARLARALRGGTIRHVALATEEEN